MLRMGAAACCLQVAWDRRIAELEDMVDILTQKVTKLEQLVRLKDTRIGALSARIVSGGSGGGGWLPARRRAPQRPTLPLSGPPASHPPPFSTAHANAQASTGGHA